MKEKYNTFENGKVFSVLLFSLLLKKEKEIYNKEKKNTYYTIK
jgi:hypothetical protein